MSPVPINYLAVLVCGLSAMVIGSLWYGPLFGKQWVALMGISKPAQMDPAMKKAMMKSYALMFIGALVMAFVLAHSEIFAATYLKVSGASAGLEAGIWNWLGFIAPATLGKVLWERKPWKLWFLDNGYWLVQLCVMGLILAYWQ